MSGSRWVITPSWLSCSKDNHNEQSQSWLSWIKYVKEACNNFNLFVKCGQVKLLRSEQQKYTEELFKKDLHDPDNQYCVITHLEPDILKFEVKWALGSITTNKASGADGLPVELFQILKDDAVKGLHSICQQICKTQQWPQDWKRSVFIPIPKKGNAKEC